MLLTTMASTVVVTAIGILTYMTTCWTLFLGALFLLYPTADTNSSYEQSEFIRSLSINIFLLVLFALQHSVLATDFVKNIFERCGLESTQRAVYVASTSAVLQVVIRKWQPIGFWYLWDSSPSSGVQHAVMALHLLSWFSIACSSLALDYPELLGMKQIYYSLRNLDSPMDYKSPTVRRLYSHCRHPILLPLLVLVWATPCMSVDRLVLAIGLPLYLLARSGLDWEDASYVHEQFLRKQMKLNCQ